MITSIKIKNFKALSNFEICGLGQFVCLIGLNGAGKSTLLQALDFVATSFDNLTKFRDWKNSDILNARLKKLRRCTFEFGLRLKNGCSVVWTGAFNVDRWRFVEESVKTDDGHSLLSVKEGRLSVSDGESFFCDLRDSTYTGSVFSTRKFESCPRLKEIKDVFLGLKSFELLAPDELRRGSRKTDRMSLGGRGLSGFIRLLDSKGAKDGLVSELKPFYPRLSSLPQTKPGPGWFGFAVQEKFSEQISTDMRHVNDGFLRILAIMAQRHSDKQTLLFDEIENGINQELIGQLVTTLMSDFGGRQIIVTTHSALVLNYLSDEFVKDSVFLLYRDNEGGVCGCKFFGLPEVEKKFSYLNAGQVMADTDLLELSNSLATGKTEVARES